MFFLPENPDESQQMRSCCRTASGLLKSSCGFNPSENKIVNVEYGENDQTSEGCFTRKGGPNLGCKKNAHQIGHALDLKRSGKPGDSMIFITKAQTLLDPVFFHA